MYDYCSNIKPSSMLLSSSFSSKFYTLSVVYFEVSLLFNTLEFTNVAIGFRLGAFQLEETLLVTLPISYHED